MPDNGNQQNQNQENNNDELDSKIKATVDELWNEKQQGLVTAIVNEIKPELKNIVQEEINKKEKEPEEEGEGGSQQSTPAESAEKNNLNPEETANIIAKTVQDEMNSFKEQFFKSANDNRNPQSSVDLNSQEDILNKNNQQPENNNNTNSDEESMVKTYSTTETSKILLKKQRSINPIVSAALNNL